ncbi:hypothetical protein GGTG_06730 [Gaeumannomyces tritici R3-111a-1]|uniref:Uncharacterized protein n=1 Tax=Gaeumannomyces tritici (strain R3-111a-1) TaxID=644352 RepID=J3NZN3_GAET3|nr:hypothetical protein GGTG_06730 [Gaeumannomyces tritici R3-111a-1]EJT76816.1 hypothetical protein GGTG_06730 [Gaeumannomyces tritici R3-111a-1]
MDIVTCCGSQRGGQGATVAIIARFKEKEGWSVSQDCGSTAEDRFSVQALEGPVVCRPPAWPHLLADWQGWGWGVAAFRGSQVRPAPRAGPSGLPIGGICL